MVGFFAEGDLSPNRIELARQQAAAGAGYIDLTSSNPTSQGLLFPPEILERAARSYWGERRYRPDPRGQRAAREAVAAYYAQRDPALQIDPEAIFLTASTSEAYSLLFALLSDPGDNVLGPDLTYPLFEYLAAIHRIELRQYVLDEARQWRVDPASLAEQADERTRAVLLISPHNPSGAIVRKPIPMLDRLKVPIICDEVFAEFTYRAPSTPPLATLHPDLPVFHLNGLSKLFALPDMKLGWIALNEPAYRQFGDRLELLNDTFLGANGLIQHMLPTLFAEGMPFVAQMRERVRQNFDMAIELLNRSPHVRVRAPDGGYYLFVQVFDWDDEEELVLHLLEQGVLVHPGHFYGDVLGTHLMISCLTEPSKLREGLELLLAGLAR